MNTLKLDVSDINAYLNTWRVQKSKGYNLRINSKIGEDPFFDKDSKNSHTHTLSQD
jgi:hypothetical protein